MNSDPISAPAQVTNTAGRSGVAIYDNANITSNTPSVFVQGAIEAIYGSTSTGFDESRSNLFEAPPNPWAPKRPGDGRLDVCVVG